MNILLYRIYWLSISLPTAWFSMHAMGHLIKISNKRWKQCLLLIGFWILVNTVTFIGDAFNILAAASYFLITVLITCNGSLWQKVTIGTMYASAVFSFNALRDNYFKPFLYSHPPYALIFSCLVSFLFALFLYIGIRKFAPDKDNTLSDSLWKLLLLLTATPFGIVLCVITLVAWEDYSATLLYLPAMYLALLIIALVSFISLLWCIAVLAKQQKLEQQNMFMEINRKYYEAMEQQHFEIRRLKHDLSNHMQVLSTLPEDEQSAYIRNLTDHAAAIQPLSYCADATVNAVLSVKKDLSDRYGIRLELSVDIPQKLPFDKADICALFANALDNAAEACMKLREEERVITLKSRTKKGLFCLEVSNPATTGDEDPPLPTKYNVWESDSILPTSKANKTHHGFGLRSIREIVARYKGNMELKTVDGVFDLFLYIPL